MHLRNEHWDTVCAPLGHGACPTGTRCVPHWDTVGAPLGHGACPTGTRCVPHWDTVRAPLGHGGCPAGTWCVPHWDTVRAPPGYGGCPPGYTERARESGRFPSLYLMELRKLWSAIGTAWVAGRVQPAGLTDFEPAKLVRDCSPRLQSGDTRASIVPSPLQRAAELPSITALLSPAQSGLPTWGCSFSPD
jgi:hypothetical protein